jgi:pimeloyl-ACP methyl ester carboxylesterase
MKGVTIDGDIYTSEWGTDFGEIRVPMEFWHGDEDRNIPFEMVKEYVSWIPTAETHFLEGEGHYSMIGRTSREVVPSLLAGAPRGELSM